MPFSEMRETNDKIHDAIMLGNVGLAVHIASERIIEVADNDKKIASVKNSIKQSIRLRQPSILFEAKSELDRRKFLAWAKENLPVEDYNRIVSIDSTYRDTAKKSGLWTPDDKDIDLDAIPKNQRKLTKEQVRAKVEKMFSRGNYGG